MARTAKKEKALTPEEKLAQALVPDVEQPYRVPENWCWIHLLDSFDNRTDSKKKIQQKTYLEEGALAIVDQGQGVVGGYSNDDEMRYTGTLPVIIFGDHTRCIKYVDFPFAQGADGVKVLAPKECFLPKAFFYALRSIDIPNMGYRRHYPLFKNYSIPVPPLAEQQRIVDRIESLFAKLDEAKEKAQTVVDGFEDRRAAILHKAFTGELTSKWRDTHGITMDEWENAPLETMFQLRSGSTIDVSEEREYGAIPYVKVADMNLPENEIQITTSSRFVDKCPESHVIPEGSTIFPKRGGAILTNKKRYVGIDKIIADLNTMAIMPIDGKAYGWYGYYWMQSVDLRQLNNGSNVPQINNKDMVKLFVPKPSINEQKEIVSILDSVFEQEFQAKEAAEQVIDQIDTMKKSILARAFRGELGTNNPADESAMELLKRVLTEGV